VAARRLATAAALAADLAGRLRVGESPQSDALAASADAAASVVTLSGAEAQLGVARAALAAVVGADFLPRLDMPGSTSQSKAADALATHPRVAAAERAVAVAQASAKLVQIENRDNPEIAFDGINEKQPGTRWDTRFGVVVRFPFATEARNAPRRAAAELANTQAQVQLALARRDVLAGIRQAQALLAGAERANVAADRAAGELEKRRGQIERAWRMGEMPLIEVVRAQQASFDATLIATRAAVAADVASLRMSLAGGVVP